MNRYWLIAAAAAAVIAAPVMAQTSSADGASSVIKTEKTISNGVVTDKVQTKEKTQTYGNENGELTARTSTRTSGETTTTVLPRPPVTTTTTTTTTTQQVKP